MCIRDRYYNGSWTDSSESSRGYFLWSCIYGSKHIYRKCTEPVSYTHLDVYKRQLRSMENGLAINPLIAKAIAMGDEFHQRNIAASLVFLKEMAPLITEMKDISEKDRYDVIKFLADTDQFFLNIMMATGCLLYTSRCV